MHFKRADVRMCGCADVEVQDTEWCYKFCPALLLEMRSGDEVCSPNRLFIKKNITRVARIAVARKLLLLAYTIFTKNIKYINNYNPALAGNIRCV